MLLMRLVQSLAIILLALLFVACTPPDRTVPATIIPDNPSATPTPAPSTQTPQPTVITPTLTATPVPTRVSTPIPTRTFVPTPTEAPAPPTATTAGAAIMYNNTRYRTGPGLWHPVYGHLHQGHPVEVLGQSNLWCRILNERFPIRADTFVFCELLKSESQ